MTTSEADAVPLLLVGFGSGVSAVPDAMLVNEPPDGAVTVTVKLVEPPFGSVIAAHVSAVPFKL